MKLDIATRQYVEANKSDLSARMISAAKKAIDSGRSEWEKIMTAILAAIIEDFGSDTAEDLGAKPKSDGAYEAKWEFDPATIAIRRWIIKNGAKDITSILATNLGDVRGVILAGVDENLSTAQISKNLRKFYVDKSPYKATRVARTEVCKASGFGNLEAAKQSRVAKKKTWLSSRDDRVRDEHQAIDGETVNLNDTFSNGLQHPEEPMCRCVLTFQSGRKEAV